MPALNEGAPWSFRLTALIENHPTLVAWRSEIAALLAIVHASAQAGLVSAKDRDRTEGILEAALGLAQQQRDSWAKTAEHYAAQLIATAEEWDTTDGAHPCWWRGHDNGAQGMERKLQPRIEAARSALTTLLQMSKYPISIKTPSGIVETLETNRIERVCLDALGQLGPAPKAEPVAQ